MLRVGLASVSITPRAGLLMSGMIDPPRGQVGRWPLHARAIVFDDGSTRAAVLSLDLLFLNYNTVRAMRSALAPAGGLVPENVMIACTHTHRAPYACPLMDEPVDFDYVDFLTACLGDLVRRATDSLRPARVRVGHIQAPGWAWNRRPIYEGDEVGTQGPCYGPDFLDMEGPEDSELTALLVEGYDGVTLGGLVNFACHTTVTGDLPYYSADFPGPLTEHLQDCYGGPFVFLQGAAGNIWPFDKREGRPWPDSSEEHNERMGEGLAARAIEALSAAEPISGERVRVERRVLRLPQRQPTREQVALARWYLESRPADLDIKDFHRCMYDGHEYTFHGSWGLERVEEWFCRETIAMWEWQRHQTVRRPSEDVEVQAIAVGDDLAFVGYPAEYFTEFGLETKAGSPFRHTFVAELANGWVGYVPTAAAFAHGGYECRLGYQSRMAPETGDTMCRTGIGLLHMLSAT